MVSSPTAGQRRRCACFAACAPGLEALVRAELAVIAPRARCEVQRGGVSFSATTRELYAANLRLRSATRVLVRAGSFTARTFADLERRAAEITWHDWLAPGRVPRFRVSSSRSRLYHTDAVAERLARVSETSPATRAGGHPEQTVAVRIARDRVTISIDSSGEPLYKRGWRLANAKAPLRETLAAAMLLAVGWDGSVPLVDPLCGSGTIPIEAALLARNIAPGSGRSFAFEWWPIFEPGTWASVTGEARASVKPETGLVAPIQASDRDAGAIEAARANAARAGVSGSIEFRRRTISELEAPGGGSGWLVTNPPYGVRVSAGKDLRDLYARLGERTRTVLDGWSVALLVADTRLAGHTGLDLHELLRTTSGGIPVRLLVS